MRLAAIIMTLSILLGCSSRERELHVHIEFPAMGGAMSDGSDKQENTGGTSGDDSQLATGGQNPEESKENQEGATGGTPPEDNGEDTSDDEGATVVAFPNQVIHVPLDGIVIEVDELLAGGNPYVEFYPNDREVYINEEKVETQGHWSLVSKDLPAAVVIGPGEYPYSVEFRVPEE